MPLRCGLVGQPQSGKTTIFNAITAAHASMFDAAEAHRASVIVPDPRVGRLVDLYRPERVCPASVEVVDIPGLEAGTTTLGGRGARLLTHIKESDVLVHVVRCFAQAADAPEPLHDIEHVDLQLMAADADTLERKLSRIAKRTKGGDVDARRETEDCQRVLARLHDGLPARRHDLSMSERRSVLECALMSLKPVLYVANVEHAGEMDSPWVQAVQEVAEEEGAEAIAICGRDEAEVNELPEPERGPFLEELGLHEPSVARLIHAAYRELNLVDFFTAGPKEVHVWTCPAGSSAPRAAGKIHSDMERRFIRMEVIAYEDLIEYGSEDAAIRAGKRRLEGKDYIVRDGDIVVVRFSPSR